MERTLEVSLIPVLSFCSIPNQQHSVQLEHLQQCEAHYSVGRHFHWWTALPARKSSFTLTWNLFFQFLGLKGNLKLANFSIIILQLRNLKLERIKPLFYPWVVCQHQKQKWTSLLCPTPDNPEDILKHYCVPPTRQWECLSYLNLHYPSLLPVDKVSPVHVSFTAWPPPLVAQMSHDQKSLKLDLVIGPMNFWSSYELDSIVNSLIPLRAHIKPTTNETVSNLFSHTICPFSAWSEHHPGYTVPVCSPVSLPLSISHQLQFRDWAVFCDSSV